MWDSFALTRGLALFLALSTLFAPESAWAQVAAAISGKVVDASGQAEDGRLYQELAAKAIQAVQGAGVKPSARQVDLLNNQSVERVGVGILGSDEFLRDILARG